MKAMVTPMIAEGPRGIAWLAVGRGAIGLGLLLALALMLGGGCMRRSEGQSDAKEEGGVPVIVAPARVDAMAKTVTVTGTIRAQREAEVSAQVSAQVVQVTVREGDRVSDGQVLIRLDDAETGSVVAQAEAGVEAARARLEAAQRRLEILEEGTRDEELAIARSRLEQAESALRTAEADLERLKDLFEEGAVSRQQLDAAQTGYDTARTNRDSARKSLELAEKGAREKEIEAARKEVEAAAASFEQAKGVLAQAQERQSYTVILSPLDGIVVERNVDPGEVTNPGMGEPLLLLADPAAVYFEATVPERVALSVEPAQRVDIIVQGNGDRRVEGEVERLVPVANPLSRDFLLRISIKAGGQFTKPGMFARGAVVVQESPDAVLIPKDAVVERAGETLVFVVDGGVAERRDVQIGLTDEQSAEVLSGVAAGESVVIVGAQGLRDGDPVLIRQSEEL